MGERERAGIDADDVCVVNQVRKLLNAYEGFREYDTEMDLRTSLNEYIGVATAVG